MTTERRYSEEEVAAIFERAADAQETAQRGRGASEGLTLAELQEIGTSVGITPAFIARAATTVDYAPSDTRRTTVLGLPLGVERTVELPGTLSDDAWEHLVVDLRTTFRASGTLRQDGSLRQWSNGNLHVLVEPSATGHRLRLRTLSGRAQSGLTGGGSLLAMGLFMMILFAVTSTESVMAIVAGAMMLVGLGMAGSSAIRVSSWARTREQQMEALAARAVALVEEALVEETREASVSTTLSPDGARVDLDAVPDAEEAVLGQRARRLRRR